jgi:hypothetical protein
MLTISNAVLVHLQTLQHTYEHRHSWRCMGELRRSSTHHQPRRLTDKSSQFLTPPFPTKHEAGWTPQLVWTFWITLRSVATTGNRNPDFSQQPSHYVTILTELFPPPLPHATRWCERCHARVPL